MSALQKISSEITQIPQRDLREVEGMNAFFIIPTNGASEARRAVHDAPAAREAARRARRDRPRDGPAGRVAVWACATSSSAASKLKDAAGERLFALSTARVTLETELGLKSAGVGGRLLQAAVGRRVRARRERAAAAARRGRGRVGLEDRAQDGRVRLRVADRPRRRPRGSRHDRAPGRLRARRRAASAPQLLAAVFRFEGKGFDGGRSTGSTATSAARSGRSCRPATGKERDNAEELELKAKLEKELPIEQDLTRWFALFDAPL